MDDLLTRELVEEALGGPLSWYPDEIPSGIETDTRRPLEGRLFFALSGENFDGHDFVTAALEGGAAAAVVREDFTGTGSDAQLIRVPDPRRLLGDLAKTLRSRLTIPVVAIAGSNGKTTTKDILAHLLSSEMETLWSQASFNNDIGLPVTLLGLRESHQAVVLEMGTNHPGELSRLVEIAQPSLAVVTSIGREHLEFFGDMAGVAEEEGTVGARLPDDGSLFINSDTPYADSIAERCTGMVIKVGGGLYADWAVSSIQMDSRGVRFSLSAADHSACSGDYFIPLPGKHNAFNAALAIAVASSLGVSPERIREALSTFKGPSMRMDVVEVDGVMIINDAYNANADSTLAALETLKGMNCEGRRIAVIGHMAELGEHTEEAHLEVGNRAAGLGLDAVITLGEGGRMTATACSKSGMRNVYHFESSEEAVRQLKDLVSPGDVVLFKASRSARLESMVRDLVNGGLLTGRATEREREVA